MNDPQFIECARQLAERALRDGGDNDVARLDYVARRLLARQFTAEERPVVEQSLSSLVSFYREHLDDARQLLAFGESHPSASLDVATLAGWTMLANEVMNLDEVLNK